MDINSLIKKVKLIEVRSKKKSESRLIGQYHSIFKGQGITFSEARKYQFGDDIRRIDWNKTAHFREPFIKLMEEERELTMILLVDISSSMNYGSKHQKKRELVAEICASLGFSAVRNNDKVGLILFADKIYKIIPPQKGKKHVLSIISQILSSNDIPSKTNIDRILEYTINIFKKKSLIFIFSDFNDDFSDKNLQITAKKHQLLGIRVSDKKDDEIPKIGFAEFQDMETGEKVYVNTSDARFRYQFKEMKKQYIKQIQNIFIKNSANFIDINSEKDYAKELYQYFRKG